MGYGSAMTSGEKMVSKLKVGAVAGCDTGYLVVRLAGLDDSGMPAP